MSSHRLITGNCLEALAALDAESVQCCVTSPPYWALRNYGVPPTEWPAVTFRPMAGLPEITIPAMRCCHGLEADPMAFVGHEVAIFREVRRVLKQDGLLWVNLGDTYASRPQGAALAKFAQQPHAPHATARIQNATRKAEGVPAGLKHKDLCGIPWRVAFALQADGWWLRCDIVWHKTNAMPESVPDRPTKAHEYIFLLSKSERYFYDATAVMEPVSGGAHPRGNGVNPKARTSAAPNGWNKDLVAEAKPKRAGKNSRMHLDHDIAHAPLRKNKQNESFSAAVRGLVEKRSRRSVWPMQTSSYKGAHSATFPPELPRTCIQAGSRPGDTVLDCFGGSGTTAAEAHLLGRNSITIELNPKDAALIRDRFGLWGCVL